MISLSSFQETHCAPMEERAKGREGRGGVVYDASPGSASAGSENFKD